MKNILSELIYRLNRTKEGISVPEDVLFETEMQREKETKTKRDIQAIQDTQVCEITAWEECENRVEEIFEVMAEKYPK